MITVDQPSCNYLRCSCPSCSGGGRGETCIPHIVAACCNVFAVCLQCVCSVLQRENVTWGDLYSSYCCSVLQFVAVCVQCVCSVFLISLKRVAVCCSVCVVCLQCVCSVLAE